MIQKLLIELVMLLSVAFTGPGGKDSGVPAGQPYECTDCHGDLLEPAVRHYPAEDGCENCHEPTGASHPSDSLGFRLMDRVPALCFYCHDEPETPAHTHYPVTSGECLGCHDAHASAQASLMRLPEPGLCLSCHSRNYRSDSSATANIGRLVAGNMMPHSAIEGGGCSSCHQAHGSDFRALLVDRFPEPQYVPAVVDSFALCFLCHDTDLLEAEETQWGTGFRDGQRNLHWLHINGSKGRNCRMCHDLHGSPQPFLIREQLEFGNWEMQMNFVPGEQGGSCLPGCHGKLSYQR